MSALPQASALSFVTYLPVRRTIPYANRSQPRRPTEGPADENSDAVPRSSRSLPGSNQRNQNRRRSPQQSQPTASASRSASDLFGFFDGEENGDQDIPNLAQKRPERPRSRPRESVNDSKGAEGENSFEEGTAKPDGDSAGIDEEIILEDPDARDGEPIDIDDNIDGGFYSRYRKEAGPGQRVVDYSSLDAQERNSSEVDKNSQEGSARRMDRETAAASAFDAVDKLFGSIDLGKQGIMKKGVAPRKQKPDGGKGTGRPQTGQIDRAKWLADLKARASTKGARDLLAGEGDEDSLAVDVNAVDDDSSDSGTESVRRGGARNEFHPAMDDRFEEAEIGDESEMNSFAPRKSGFRAQKRAVRASESSEDSLTPPDGEEKQDTNPTEDKSDGETSFQKLMAIAREGPKASSGNRSKQPRSTRPSMLLRNQALRSGNPQKRKEPQERKTTREPRIDEGRAPPASNISRILGLTKQIDSRRADAPREKDDDSYEALDDEMEESISIRGDAVRKGSLRRQKFTAVRRVANRSFKIHKPPDEWKPMTEEEIAKVRSDGRSIGGGRVGSSKGKGIVANCQTCRGSGLDTCSACLGSGWVPPLDKIGMSESRKELLEKIWNRPNLCVDNYGEAQCILCNGIGKQFCDSCKGSGSALRKGFSLSEKREIFDFDDPEEDDSCLGEDEDADIDEDDVDEYEEDEEEEYQLYTGPEESFNFHRTSTSFNSETGDGDESDDDLRIGNEDELEVDDESAELLATLEAMHLADLEERGSERMGDRKRRSEVNDRARDARDAGFDLDIESDEIMDDVSGEHGIEENMKMTELDDEDDLDDDLDEEDDDLDNDDDDDLDDEDEDDLDDDIDDDRIVNEIESRGLELNLDDVSEDDDELE